METTRVSPARLAWLERETGRWRDRGFIAADARERILASYESEPLVSGPVLLVVLAVLMFGVGVLLLIAYNWHRIPDAAKVAMILSAVAAAFAGSALACARERPIAAEALALTGTLLYGNGIWLIAQVLHIQGYFPDAFLWFGIGAGVCAWLLGSTLIGVETAIVLIAWVIAASAATERPVYLFLAAWPAVVALAYRLRSATVVAVAALAVPVWAFFSTVAVATEPLYVGVAAATACALYVIGSAHRDETRMRLAWHLAGLVPLLVTFIPLLVLSVHRTASRNAAGFVALPVAIAIVAVVLVAILARRRMRDPATVSVVVAAAALFLWTMSLATGAGRNWLFAPFATVAFSVLALVLAVSFIRTALRTSHSYEFATGVLFAVLFIAVRWVSVIHNMFLSGLIMLAAGAGLLFVVRLWRQRDRALALQGRLS